MGDLHFYTSDHGILISHLLYEIEHCPLSAGEAREKRLAGGFVPTALFIDAKSVFAAVTATFIKQPAEKNLLCHVQYLRELLDKGIMWYLFWIDTRDMGTYGMAKRCRQQG